MSNKIHGLTTVITYNVETRGNRKVVVGSNVYVAMKTDKGNIGVASATLGGKYNEHQAMKEFKDQPKRFQAIQPGYDLAKAAKLV